MAGRQVRAICFCGLVHRATAAVSGSSAPRLLSARLRGPVRATFCDERSDAQAQVTALPASACDRKRSMWDLCGRGLPWSGGVAESAPCLLIAAGFCERAGGPEGRAAPPPRRALPPRPCAREVLLWSRLQRGWWGRSARCRSGVWSVPGWKPSGRPGHRRPGWLGTAQSASTAAPHSGDRNGRRLAMDRQTTKTMKGNPIFGTSLVAWTVPWVTHRPVWVSTSLAMVFLPVIGWVAGRVNARAAAS
jgi:hypothetical protein